MNRKLLDGIVKIPAFFLLCAITAQVSMAGTIDPDDSGHKYAYGQNIGWTTLAPATGGGIIVSSSKITGYAWSPNAGWINFSPENFGGVLNDGNGNLSGWGWGERVGWISFSCANMNSCASVDYGVKINTSTGLFSGYAWGANIGWINFTLVSFPDYAAKTSFYRTISGKVTDEGNPVEAAQIAFSHDGHVEYTDENGEYVYDVPDHTSTTLPPSHPMYSAWSPPYRQFTDICENFDSQDFSVFDDLDGVAALEESGPNGDNPYFDGNGDDFSDNAQGNVASLNTENGQYYVTLACPKNALLSDVAAAENPSPSDSPARVAFPLGFFDFNITGIIPGASSTITFFLPKGVQASACWKYGPTPDNPEPHWYNFLFDGQTGAKFIDNTIVLFFIDGQRGDGDLSENGVIGEVGGPGFTYPIPSLNRWGAIFLALVITLITIRKSIKRKYRFQKQ